MQRRLINEPQDAEAGFELVDLTTPPASPATAGMFKDSRRLSLKKPLEKRELNKSDICYYPIKQYCRAEITFHKLLTALNIIPVDYIEFKRVPADILKHLQSGIMNQPDANPETKQECSELLRALESDDNTVALKQILIQAFCQKWEIDGEKLEITRKHII